MIKNVALIGAGTISESHLSALQLIPDVCVKTICNHHIELAQIRAAQYGVANVCADYKEVLADPQIDGVIVVTPTYTHAGIILDALQAGKHVMCEKPPALTYADALACEEAARKAGKVLMYGFVLRFYDTYRYLKQYIDEGGLGDIYYAEASRMQNCSQIGGWFRDKSQSCAHNKQTAPQGGKNFFVHGKLLALTVVKDTIILPQTAVRGKGDPAA